MGDEIIADGKRLFQGLIRHAKDTQTLFNFGMTQQAVTLALTPRAPYVAALGQIAQNPALKDMWDNANTRNYSVLYYEPQSVDGTMLPPPQRQHASSPDSGWLNWTQQMSMLMKSTIGMYQNNLGMPGQETSGRAILAKQQQGDNATFHYLDNHGRAIGLTGRILVECIPTYYDTERIVHIIGPDDMPKLETINQQAPNPADPMRAIQMKDVTVGEYAVVVESGPTYATKKQEKADLVMGLVQAYPPLMQIAPDLVVKAQDLPDADQFVKRLKMTLPPNILQAMAAEEEGKAPPDPQMMAQMEQMQQQQQQMDQFIQQLQAENQQLKTGEQSKMQAAQIDAQVKSQATQTDAQVKAQAAQMSAQAEMDKAQLDAQIEMQKAEMQAQVALKKAELEAQTKLMIAQMNKTGEPEGDEGAGKGGGEKEDDAQEMAVLLPVLQQMAESIDALTGPKKLIRDPQGRVVQIVTPKGTQSVAYDDNGRIAGVH
jgi:YD repeat-containing protein